MLSISDKTARNSVISKLFLALATKICFYFIGNEWPINTRLIGESNNDPQKSRAIMK